MHPVSSEPALSFLVAARDRRDLTVRALSGAIASAREAGFAARVVLYDDGSTDGTGEAVIAMCSTSAEVLRGDGNAFWARSMARAERHALEARREPDLLVWLNDDVELDPDAISRLVDTSSRHPARVVIGSMRDPDTGETTYGGLVRSGPHPLAFALVEPGEEAQEVDAMNGNLVLVPLAVAQRMGGIDGGFSHALADIDYATRASRLGIRAILAPGTYGSCRRTPPPPREPSVAAWRRFVGTKGGGNPRSTARILRRLAPTTWPVWWAITYVLWWTRTWRSAALQRRRD